MSYHLSLIKPNHLSTSFLEVGGVAVLVLRLLINGLVTLVNAD